MKLVHSVLAIGLIASAADPCPAQSNALLDANAARLYRLRVDADLAGPTLLLLAAEPRIAAFTGQPLLADATLLLPKPVDATHVGLDLYLTAGLRYYWQAVRILPSTGLAAGPIQAIVDGDPDRDGDGLADDAVRPECAAWSGLPLLLKIARNPKKVGGCRLWADFDAPSDDWALAVVDVAVTVTDDGSVADVLLYRKVPGPGEGLRDVVEHHTLTVELPCTDAVRVFLAEGTRTRPAECQAFRLMEKLTPP